MSNSSITLGVVILGAGRSTRMGRPKLLLPWGETSIVGHLLRQWRQVNAEQIKVVHAEHDNVLTDELGRLSLASSDRIANPNPGPGMFTSILCAARSPQWKGTLTHFAIVLGDQPHLQTETLRKLVVFAGQHPEKISQPFRNRARRHPVILPKRSFLELADSPAGTLKDFLLAEDGDGFECDDPGLDLDIDRPEDYTRALVLAGLKAS